MLITTSRDPSSKLLQFSKVRTCSFTCIEAHHRRQEMRLVIPNSHRLNRGAYVMSDLVAACMANKMTDLVVLHEHRGVPDALVVSHLPHGPTVLFTLHNVVLRHDVTSGSTSTVSEQYPHLIFDGFSTKLGDRIKNVLRFLFPVPKEDSKRVMTFANEGDFISFRCVSAVRFIVHRLTMSQTSRLRQKLAQRGPARRSRAPIRDATYARRHLTRVSPRLTRRDSLRDPTGHHRAEGGRHRMGPAAVPPHGA